MHSIIFIQYKMLYFYIPFFVLQLFLNLNKILYLILLTLSQNPLPCSKTVKTYLSSRIVRNTSPVREKPRISIHNFFQFIVGTYSFLHVKSSILLPNYLSKEIYGELCFNPNCRRAPTFSKFTELKRV